MPLDNLITDKISNSDLFNMFHSIEDDNMLQDNINKNNNNDDSITEDAINCINLITTACSSLANVNKNNNNNDSITEVSDLITQRMVTVSFVPCLINCKIIIVKSI